MRDQAPLEPHLRATAKSIHQDLLDERVPIEPNGIRRRVRQAAPLCTEPEVERVVELVVEQLHGLGPIDTLLRDPAVTEVMINGPGAVWVERAGRLERTGVVLDDDDLRLVIDRVVGPLGVRLDRLRPYADARLDDGSRVHIAVAPMAVDGPYVTIRRFTSEPLPLSAFGPPDRVAVLQALVERRANVVVSGATGAGKTALLNALCATVGAEERMVTIEDAAELRLGGGHVVRLEARPPTAEGQGELTIRSLARNALRMRPDRLIVGEVRGAEAFDMMQAMSTGHDGCLSTCHADSPTEAIERLIALALMSGMGLSAGLVRELAHRAIDAVVHVTRDKGGTRSVVSVLVLAPRNDDDPRWLIVDGQVTEDGHRWLRTRMPRHGTKTRA